MADPHFRRTLQTHIADTHASKQPPRMCALVQVVIERKERLLRLLQEELEAVAGPHARVEVAMDGGAGGDEATKKMDDTSEEQEQGNPPLDATPEKEAGSEEKEEKGTLYL